MRPSLPLAVIIVMLALASLVQPRPARAQESRPNGIFLVAKPELNDANFRRTVVLVTRSEDAQTIGVIINRPTKAKLAQLLPRDPDAVNYREPVFFGGPVRRQTLVAAFRSATPPAAPAFQLRRGLYLSTHPDNIRALLAAPDAQYRLYAGFSSWAPRQLEAELARDGWYVLPADADIVFRKDMQGVWEELLQRALARKTNIPGPHSPDRPPGTCNGLRGAGNCA